MIVDMSKVRTADDGMDGVELPMDAMAPITPKNISIETNPKISRPRTVADVILMKLFMIYSVLKLLEIQI
jgi:hypothetical protein